VYDVQDWAEVRRLKREGWTNSAIAEKFGMSRNTVAELIARDGPPRYERAPAGSMLDDHADAIAAMLDEDPKAPATVILERLRLLGYHGGITILKERLAELRPGFLAARSYQRTTYLPGELSHVDWWETGVQIPVGKGATREAMGLVASLPHSAAHAAVFTFTKTTADFCPALVGCLERLGGVSSAAVLDNDTAMVKPRRGGPARLVDDVAALFGALRLKPIVLRPRFPEGKGRCGTSRASRTCSSNTTAGRAPLLSSAGRVGWPGPWPRHGGSSGASSPRCRPRCRRRSGTSKCGSPKTVSSAAVTSTIRCRRDLAAVACSSSSRSPRCAPSSTASSSRVMPAATSPPTWYSILLTPARSDWPVTPNAVWKPRTFRFPRSTSHATTRRSGSHHERTNRPHLPIAPVRFRAAERN
jgi:transposase